jgi:hypothetical protein
MLEVKVSNEWGVPNQFIIKTDEGQYFQSHDSIIAFIPVGVFLESQAIGDNKIQLDETYWDYSKTTGKYRNKFLNEGIAETRKKIKSGQYELINLN